MDRMDLQTSSFVNVTLAFWTNENGLAIAPQEFQKHPQNKESELLDSSKNNNSPDRHIRQLPNGDNSRLSSKNNIDSTVQRLINSLLSDQLLDIKNDTILKNNDDVNNGVLANVSRITKKLFDNVTNTANDTFPCFPTDLNTNECLWKNETQNSTVIEGPDRVYWALFLVILPILALFGNILVILSVYRERSLQTVTNWFIVSLAFADLFVTIPMVFSLYVMVNVDWELSEAICDLYIAIDVICSTASIFNLVAISFDRYIAVTHPIFYSKHKNDKRVIFTIVIVWIASAGVGLPIVLGANTSADRIPELCIFYNSNFIIYSSLWSFYVPCVIMVILYYKIFKAIHNRAKKAIGSRKTYASSASESVKTAEVIENVAQTKRFQDDLQQTIDNEKAMANSKIKAKLPLITEMDAITNAGSGGSQADEDEDEGEKDEIPLEMVECHIIKNKQAEEPEYMLTVSTGTQRKYNKNIVQSPIEAEVTIGPNGNTNNTDSGYAPSHIEETCTQFCLQNPNTESPDDKSSPVKTKSDAVVLVVQNINKNGSIAATQVSTSSSSPNTTTGHNHHHHHQKHNDSVSHSGSTTASATGAAHNPHRPAKKKSRFNLGRKHKSTRKKREKASAKRERKATKTLAIVLGVFLLCWTPFFSCNILDAICIKLHDNEFIKTDCRPGMIAFLLTTWLGYMNSCANPLIYTIFNPEFRKAFRKILQQIF